MARLFLTFLLIALSPLAACAGKLKVVTSFSILGDLTKNIGGEEVEVKSLVGPNGDAHVYEPTARDVATLASADLFIVNGLGFETWSDRLVASSGYKGPQLVATRGIVPRDFGQNAPTPDPHAWQDVANAKIYAANILDALVMRDPAHGTLYKTRAAKFTKELDALDRWTRAQIDTVPSPERSVITSHNAFGYFAHAYGVKFIPAHTLSAGGEDSAANIARLVDDIRTHKVTAVFMENITDPRLAHQLEEDAGAYIGGTLYSDALSPAGGPAGTYIDLFRYNVAELVQGMLHNKPPVAH